VSVSTKYTFAKWRFLLTGARPHDHGKLGDHTRCEDVSLQKDTTNFSIQDDSLRKGKLLDAFGKQAGGGHYTDKSGKKILIMYSL
jgi:hypothetical protein